MLQVRMRAWTAISAVQLRRMFMSQEVVAIFCETKAASSLIRTMIPVELVLRPRVLKIQLLQRVVTPKAEDEKGLGD